MESDREHRLDRAHAVIVGVKGEPTPPTATSVPGIELDLSKFRSGRWALQLDAVFARRREPAVILAQGVACLAVAWWAQLSPRSYMDGVGGAVFLAPLNVGFGQEAVAASARLGPATRLPFASVVVNAAYPFVDRLLALADGWGSHFVDKGAAQAGPTNRRGTGSTVEAQLLALLPLLDGAHPAVANPTVSRFVGSPRVR